MLTRLLKNAFGGQALTLIFSCISPLIEDLEESMNCLMFAKRAANIKNNPSPNIKTLTDEFSADFDEELSMINNKTMPDLITNGDHHQNFLIQQHFLMQQQAMLNHYLIMMQQQQNQGAMSPFVPILASPGSSSTLDLKSPLNVQMYLANNNENQVPLSIEKSPQIPENPWSLSKKLPNDAQETAKNQVKKTAVEQSTTNKTTAESAKNQRKSSLSQQKTLDSILEESEHDSSINRKSSISSLSSSFDEETSEEEFDSENSDEISEGDEDENLPDSDEIFLQFKSKTDQIQDDIQDGILDELINVAIFERIPSDFEKKQSDLNDLVITLDEVQKQISALDDVIKVKDEILEEVAKSSLEMRQARQCLEVIF